MSFFNEANEDAFSVVPEAAATGPLVGFLESFSVGYQQQVRASAMYGIENEMFKLDDSQVRAMKRAGIEDAPSLSPDDTPYFNDPTTGLSPQAGAYLDVARFYADGGDPSFADKLTEYDKRIGELQTKYPDLKLKTSREMFDNVRAAAQEYENRSYNDRRTLGGSVGSFFGGAIGALNPNSDPINFLSTPIGGIGKSVITRVAGQGAAQGFVEGLNQITGVQEQRRLLGLDYGFGDAVARVGGAIVGGAALQAVGEGVVFGARRFFRSTPNDPAPLPDSIERAALPDTSGIPPQVIPADENLAAARLTREPETYTDYLQEASPFSNSRLGRARTVLDVDYMESRLNEWTAEAPAMLKPKTDTMITLPTRDFIAPDFARFAEKSQVDELARRVDPDTFRIYDSLAERKQIYKGRIEEVGNAENQALQTQIDAIDAKMYDLAMKAEQTGGKRAAKLRNDIKKLDGEKAKLVDEQAKTETPEVARFRRLMMQEDEKMRELAPLVSRAYARAQQNWTNTDADRKALYSMMRDGRQTLPVADEQLNRVVVQVEQALEDRAPILRSADKVRDKVGPDADAADVAAAIVADNMKVLDEALETYASSIDQLIDAKISEEFDGTINVPGQDYRLHLDNDTIVVPNADGTGSREITIRQLLEETKANDHELEAVSTCSLRKTS